MPKRVKSLTIFGVRGLRVHERTPAFSRPATFVPDCTDLVLRDAAVQAMLWGDSADQMVKWSRVFDRAMKRYEKEQKR